MIGHLCRAAGKSDPTLVLDRRALPAGEEELTGTLLVARDWLAAHRGAEVTTIAMIEPSADPDADVDYQFAQYLPGAAPRFELRGSCGHSILSSIAVAQRLGWLPSPGVSSPLRVNVLNTGDRVVCEVSGAGRSLAFSVEFRYQPPRRLGDLLPTGSAQDDFHGLPVSVVSAGNPHVFVDAADLGLRDQEAVFSADPSVRRRLTGIRRAVGRRLGLPQHSVFPRVAAVGQYEYRRLAALTVPAPLTSGPLPPADAVTVAAAAVIDGTVVHRLAQQAWSRLDELVVDTPGGTTVVRTAVSGTGLEDTLTWVGVRRGTVRYEGPVFVEPLRDLLLRPQGVPASCMN
ncbi:MULTISPECIES: PrpF domain-containing protein [unclassified Streptomyces]|uniref:PrpF domain-containing protein n=1 Tax=unclassified Streptomyces TaxID=2593676 RepID=UPI0040429E3C